MNGLDKRVFEKFSRFDEESGEPGLGMGLYLVKQLVEQGGGSVGAYCTDDERFCVEVRLPLLPDPGSSHV
jgi:signal transduction histidine kinase